MHKTIKQQVGNGEMVLHWWEDGTGDGIDCFMLTHDAPQHPNTLPGQITGTKDKIQAVIKLVDEIKRLYPEISEAL